MFVAGLKYALIGDGKQPVQILGTADELYDVLLSSEEPSKVQIKVHTEAEKGLLNLEMAFDRDGILVVDLFAKEDTIAIEDFAKLRSHIITAF